MLTSGNDDLARYAATQEPLVTPEYPVLCRPLRRGEDELVILLEQGTLSLETIRFLAAKKDRAHLIEQALANDVAAWLKAPSSCASFERALS
jgi:hypothetical protein